MEILRLIATPVCVIALIYMLYTLGIIELKVTRAWLYFGSYGNFYKNRHKATVSGCSGFVKRVLRFKEDREYTFSFDSDISNGDIRINVLDSRKNVLLALGPDNKDGIIKPNRNDRYFLIIKFDKAGGTYELIWE